MSLYKCQLESRSRYNNGDKDRRAIPWWNRHFTSISQTFRGVLRELANVRNPVCRKLCAPSLAAPVGSHR
jgi:hypothetical protein